MAGASLPLSRRQHSGKSRRPSPSVCLYPHSAVYGLDAEHSHGGLMGRIITPFEKTCQAIAHGFEYQRFCLRFQFAKTPHIFPGKTPAFLAPEPGQHSGFKHHLKIWKAVLGDASARPLVLQELVAATRSPSHPLNGQVTWTAFTCALRQQSGFSKYHRPITNTAGILGDNLLRSSLNKGKPLLSDYKQDETLALLNGFADWLEQGTDLKKTPSVTQSLKQLRQHCTGMREWLDGPEGQAVIKQEQNVKRQPAKRLKFTRRDGLMIGCTVLGVGAATLSPASWPFIAAMAVMNMPEIIGAAAQHSRTDHILPTAVRRFSQDWRVGDRISDWVTLGVVNGVNALTTGASRVLPSLLGATTRAAGQRWMWQSAVQGLSHVLTDITVGGVLGRAVVSPFTRLTHKVFNRWGEKTAKFASSIAHFGCGFLASLGYTASLALPMEGVIEKVFTPDQPEGPATTVVVKQHTVTPAQPDVQNIQPAPAPKPDLAATARKVYWSPAVDREALSPGDFCLNVEHNEDGQRLTLTALKTQDINSTEANATGQAAIAFAARLAEAAGTEAITVSTGRTPTGPDAWNSTLAETSGATVATRLSDALPNVSIQTTAVNEAPYTQLPDQCTVGSAFTGAVSPNATSTVIALTTP